jgi:hypothetical protein
MIEELLALFFGYVIIIICISLSKTDFIYELIIVFGLYTYFLFILIILFKGFTKQSPPHKKTKLTRRK